MNIDYLILALKNLKHRGVRSWLTLLGIFIGVTAVVALISLGAGLQAAVSAQFGISATNVLVIQAGGMNNYGLPGSGAVNKLTTSDAKAIEELSSVATTITRNIVVVKTEFNHKLDIATAGSVPYGKKKKELWKALDLKIEYGRFLQDSDSRKVVLGNGFSSSDNKFGKAIQVGNKILIDGEKFGVVGILKKKGSFIFDNIILINDKPLKNLAGYGDKVDMIVAIAKDANQMNRTKNDIEKLLRKRRDVKKGEENFEITTPEAMMQTVNNILGGVRIFIVIIASLSILVGILGIINTMTTSVLERRKDIGIMKAIGAKNSQIFTQFFFESGMLGFIGGVAGVILGSLIGIIGTLAIKNFLGTNIPLTINPILIIGALLGSFLVGAIAGIIPAMRASRQNPVEALRG